MKNYLIVVIILGLAMGGLAYSAWPLFSDPFPRSLLGVLFNTVISTAVNFVVMGILFFCFIRGEDDMNDGKDESASSGED